MRRDGNLTVLLKKSSSYLADWRPDLREGFEENRDPGSRFSYANTKSIWRLSKFTSTT